MDRAFQNTQHKKEKLTHFQKERGWGEMRKQITHRKPGSRTASDFKTATLEARNGSEF